MKKKQKGQRLAETQRELGELNRNRIWNYFHENPFRTNIECASDLGMNTCVVGRHIKVIKNGWLPSGQRVNNG